MLSTSLPGVRVFARVLTVLLCASLVLTAGASADAQPTSSVLLDVGSHEVTGELQVTIVGPDLATADAYAIAAFAMGADGPQWAAALGHESLCITSDHEVLSTRSFPRAFV